MNTTTLKRKYFFSTDKHRKISKLDNNQSDSTLDEFSPSSPPPPQSSPSSSPPPSFTKRRMRGDTMISNCPIVALWDIENNDLDYHMSKVNKDELFDFKLTLPRKKSRFAMRFKTKTKAMPLFKDHGESTIHSSIDSGQGNDFSNLSYSFSLSRESLLAETKRIDKRLSTFLAKFNKELDEIEETELNIVEHNV